MTDHIKGILLGNTNVGKTSFVTKANGQDISNLQSTTGLCYTPLIMENSTICFHIWDTAGQEQFRSMLPSYYRGSQVVFFFTTCPDPEKEKQLANNGKYVDDDALVYYMDDVFKQLGNYDDFIPIFILNKADLLHTIEGDITKDSLLDKRIKEVEEIILNTRKELKGKIIFRVVSCLLNYNVTETLNDAFNMALEKFNIEETEKSDDKKVIGGVDLNSNRKVDKTNECSC